MAQYIGRRYIRACFARFFCLTKRLLPLVTEVFFSLATRSFRRVSAARKNAGQFKETEKLEKRKKRKNARVTLKTETGNRA